MKKNEKRLRVRMSHQGRLAWNFLLQKGFYLVGQAGMTVREFLAAALGYDDRTIEEQVRTIFLNSSPMDDIDSAHVRDGDRVALGGAMPGLIGICMGRDNPYKGFRSDISVRADETVADNSEPIGVFVKIFSTLAVDTGEAVLARGIILDAADLAEFLSRQQAHLLPLDGQSVEYQLAEARTMTGRVVVSVEFVG
ncbi:hypothetical protein GKC30_05235 [Pseudodesulfovibrio sp. F-1]|uniref:Uncharacterized protein n=1 Tax=Pseudodesulfovibrio alkaliphilus TaxID=2661613 RepID=A0A7K1KM73_9BACT|nr:hypothetical protein [Pseudodesulfovibrio alkaliphilus]MUM77031.1 hypothetical protein [Pseudodesulfovibrio alkaliphilus]